MKVPQFISRPLTWVTLIGGGALGYGVWQEWKISALCAGIASLLFFLFEMIREEVKRKQDEKRAKRQVVEIKEHVELVVFRETNRVISVAEDSAQKLLLRLDSVAPSYSDEDLLKAIRKTFQDARFALKSGNFSKAEEGYFSLATILKDVPDLWFYLGYSRNMQEKYNEAIEAYDVVLRIKSDFPDAFSFKGYCLGQLGNHEEAGWNYYEAAKIYANSIQEDNMLDEIELEEKYGDLFEAEFELEVDYDSMHEALHWAIYHDEKYKEMSCVDKVFQYHHSDPDFIALVGKD